MTTKEAIGWVDEIVTRWSFTKPQKEAMQMALQALREKAEKERRFVVRQSSDRTKVYVADSKTDVTMSGYFDNNKRGNVAAQRIADIYEEEYQ